MLSLGQLRCGVTLVCLLSAPAIANEAHQTSPASGPYRVAGNRILDSQGRPYLARGTELPTLTLKLADIAGDGKEFGAFSPSSLISIRQRLNMNAVRLPISPLDFEQSEAYRKRVAEVVHLANRFELLVILSSDPAVHLTAEAFQEFWKRCATEFAHHPNVFFAPSPSMPAETEWSSWQHTMQPLVDAIRSTGAVQPVLVSGLENTGFTGLTAEFQIRDPNIVYEVTPRYSTTRTDDDRHREFGFLAERAPVLVNDLDPKLDVNSSECTAFPADPGDATKLVQDSLAYFDAHAISWVLSSYRPGRMLTEYRYFNWSKLDDGWTCGESPSHGGIAMILAAHLWGTDPHGLFAVNHVNGGLVLARGGLSTAYGPILAEREVTAAFGKPLPVKLGNVSVRVTDSRGTARLARLLYTGGGWANITFVVPESSATGPAEVAVVRSDGSRSASKVLIEDVAPGFFSASSDARGAVDGIVVQRPSAGGPSKTFAASECVKGECRAAPIALSQEVVTTVRLAASGVRNAGANAKVAVTVGGRAVPVLGFGAADDVGRDQVTIRLPLELRDTGETDLSMTVNGKLSNVVRIRCGGSL